MSPKNGSDPLEHAVRNAVESPLHGTRKTQRGKALHARSKELKAAVERQAKREGVAAAVIYRRAVEQYLAGGRDA